MNIYKGFYLKKLLQSKIVKNRIIDDLRINIPLPFHNDALYNSTYIGQIHKTFLVLPL